MSEIIQIGIFLIVVTYIIVGLIFAVRHVSFIVNRLKKTAFEKDKLEKMTAQYNLTPKGADYFTQLQNMYIEQDIYIEESEKLLDKPFRYKLKSFIPAFLAWPFFLYLLNAEK